MTLAAPFFENAGVLAVIAGLPAVAVAWLAYRRSVKTDTITAQAGIATSQSGSIQQVIDGLNTHIGNLQTDNKILRERLEAAETRVDDLSAEVARISRQLRKATP